MSSYYAWPPIFFVSARRAYAWYHSFRFRYSRRWSPPPSFAASYTIITTPSHAWCSTGIQYLPTISLLRCNIMITPHGLPDRRFRRRMLLWCHWDIIDCRPAWGYTFIDGGLLHQRNFSLISDCCLIDIRFHYIATGAPCAHELSQLSLELRLLKATKIYIKYWDDELLFHYIDKTNGHYIILRRYLLQQSNSLVSYSLSVSHRKLSIALFDYWFRASAESHTSFSHFKYLSALPIYPCQTFLSFSLSIILPSYLSASSFTSHCSFCPLIFYHC